MKDLIIVGAGGYAKSVLDSLDYMNFRMVGFLDDTKEMCTEHLGYPILGNVVENIPEPDSFVYFIAIGNNAKRKRWFDVLKAHHLSLINVIDKSAIISSHSTIGEGCFIGKLAVVNSGASIGNDTVVNTRASIEHGCHIGSHVNISTCSTLNGDVHVEEGSFVGSGAVVNGQLTISEWSLVGSGAVVLHNVAAHTTVAGVPAHLIESHSHKYNTL
jgi:sugar O-acyltransferase (sialic acid O-acetyltransferase NeuD family)